MSRGYAILTAITIIGIVAGTYLLIQQPFLWWQDLFWEVPLAIIVLKFIQYTIDIIKGNSR